MPCILISALAAYVHPDVLMGTGGFTVKGKPCDGLASHPGGSRNTPSCFMLRKPDKVWPDGPLGLYADFLKLRSSGSLLS